MLVNCTCRQAENQVALTSKKIGFIITIEQQVCFVHSKSNRRTLALFIVTLHYHRC